MYQRFPGGSEAQQPPRITTAPPQSVLRASRVMYVGAAASLVGIIIDLLLRHSIRTAIVKADTSLTPAKVTSAYHAELAILVVFGLIGVGLWLWMARGCLAGKSWARVTSTVFFGIDTLAVLVGASAAPGGGLTRIYGIVVWIIGLVAIVLLWQRSSSEYFRGARRS